MHHPEHPHQNQRTYTGLEPWAVSADTFPANGGSPEKLQFCLGYAILAPSTHNTQPWLFHTTGNQVELHADFARHLPVVDPGGRELIISCGAALCHLRIALNHFGHADEVELFPDPQQPEFLARVGLGGALDPDVENVLLFNAIPKRRTNRMPFTDWPVDKELLDVLQNVARAEGAWLYFVSDEPTRFAVADLIAQADQLQWTDKAFRAELANWVHPNHGPHRDGMPGYVQGLGDLLSGVEPFVIRTFDRGASHAARDHELALQAPVLAVLGTDTDTPSSWLAAGQALSKILLRARAEDVWASFLNQPVQVASLRARLNEVIGRAGYSHLVLRLGFGPEVIPTPRRPLREVLVRRTQIFKLGHYPVPGGAPV